MSDIAPGSRRPTAAPELDEDRLAWLALALSPGLGPKRILDAVQAVGVGEPDLHAAADRAGGVAVSGRRRRSSSLTARRGRRPRQEWARVAAQGATVVTLRLPGVSGAAEGDLRSAAGAVGARRGEAAERGRRLRWWARGIRRPTGREWRRCCRGIWRCGGC